MGVDQFDKFLREDVPSGANLVKSTGMKVE